MYLQKKSGGTPLSIGTKIYELRTAKNLSQGELADRLDVSRQSVSKWETNMAVPDLDKLMKLCNVFEITLDELTGREETKPQPSSTNKPDKKTTSSAQKVIGYILFTLSLLFGLFIILFGTNEGDFIILPPIAITMLVCGLLCLFAGSKAFYWCIWTALAPITVLTPHLVGFPVLSTLTVIIVIVSVIMLFVANAVFKNVVIKTEKKKSILLILGWILPIALYVLHICLLMIDMHSPPNVAYNEIFSTILNFVCYALIAGLETYTVCYIRSLRKSTK